MNDNQKAILAILHAVDRFCDENGIQYMINGGTCLGAVREGGFISWDNDADIMMKREEFKVFQNFFPSSRYAKEEGCSLVIEDRIPRIYREGRHIDVFIIDTIPTNKLLRKIKVFCLKCAIPFTLKKDIIYHKSFSAKNMIRRIIYAITSHIVKTEKRFVFYSRVCSMFKNQSKEKLSVFISNDTIEAFGLIYNYHFFDKTKRVRFEDIYLCSPERDHEYLVRTYGEDYMTPKKDNYFRPKHEYKRYK